MTRRGFSLASVSRLFLALVFFAFFAVPLAAEEISFKADTMSGRAGSKEDTTRLAGNAQVLTESIEIRADSIELSGKEFRYVSAAGNIKGSYKESNLEFECQELSYDRESKTVSLSGDVKLIDIENEVTAGAQMIEYNSNTDIAVLQIEVKLEQKKNVCTSAYAVYRKKEQMLELNGSAKVVQDDDSFAAQSITFNMDTEEITMDGNVHGSVIDEGKKKDKKNGQEGEESQEAQEGQESGEGQEALEGQEKQEALEGQEKQEDQEAQEKQEGQKKKKGRKKQKGKEAKNE